jgi:hypothetical protein
LIVRVEGSGPMAAMWEAISKPLLPQLAKSFAVQLKAEIEKTAVAQPVAEAATSRAPCNIVSRLRNSWRTQRERNEP